MLTALLLLLFVVAAAVAASPPPPPPPSASVCNVAYGSYAVPLNKMVANRTEGLNSQ